MSCKNRYAKSCIRAYNPVAQTVPATATVLQLAGTAAVDSGCSLTLNPSSIRVNNSGLYRFSADVTVNPTAADIISVQLYKDGVPIPSALVRDSGEIGNITAMHVETDLCIQACCASNPEITLVISGAAASVTFVSIGALKLA